MSRTTWKLCYLNGLPIDPPITLTIDDVDPLVVASIEAAATRYGFDLELVTVEPRVDLRRELLERVAHDADNVRAMLKNDRRHESAGVCGAIAGLARALVDELDRQERLEGRDSSDRRPKLQVTVLFPLESDTAS